MEMVEERRIEGGRIWIRQKWTYSGGGPILNGLYRNVHQLVFRPQPDQMVRLFNRIGRISGQLEIKILGIDDEYGNFILVLCAKEVSGFFITEAALFSTQQG